jgi:hypothetical protein
MMEEWNLDSCRGEEWNVEALAEIPLRREKIGKKGRLMGMNINKACTRQAF